MGVTRERSELSRAVQELRKQAELELDDTIELWLTGPEEALTALSGHIHRVAEDTLADLVRHEPPPADALSAEQQLHSGTVLIALRRHGPEA